jgi:hypothetical protein
MFLDNIEYLQVLHDCLKFVSWDVWLIPLTGETLVFNEFVFDLYKNDFLKRMLMIN